MRRLFFCAEINIGRRRKPTPTVSRYHISQRRHVSSRPPDKEKSTQAPMSINHTIEGVCFSGVMWKDAECRACQGQPPLAHVCISPFLGGGDDLCVFVRGNYETVLSKFSSSLSHSSSENTSKQPIVPSHTWSYIGRCLLHRTPWVLGRYSLLLLSSRTKLHCPSWNGPQFKNAGFFLSSRWYMYVFFKSYLLEAF